MTSKNKYGLLKKPVKDKITGKIRYHKLSPGPKSNNKTRRRVKSRRKSKSRNRKSNSRVKKSRRRKSKSRVKKSRRRKSKSRVKKSRRRKSNSRVKKSRRRKSNSMSTVTAINIESIGGTGFNQCYVLTIHGKKYSIHVPENQSEAIEKLCPIKVQKELKTAENGIYTYVVLRDKSNNLNKIFFTRNNSGQEICSKHGNIIKRIKNKVLIYYKKLRSGNVYFADKILYAGEFLKEYDEYYFNFMSGTYAPREKINNNPELYRKNLRELLEDNGIPEKDIKIYATLEEFKMFKPSGTFITKGSVKDPFTEDESEEYLKKLRDSGIKFYLFDLEDPEIDNLIKRIREWYYNYFRKKILNATTEAERRKWIMLRGKYPCEEFLWLRDKQLKQEIITKGKRLAREVMETL